MPDVWIGVAAVAGTIAGFGGSLAKDWIQARREDHARFATDRREVYAKFNRASSRCWDHLIKQPIPGPIDLSEPVDVETPADLREVYDLADEIRLIATPPVWRACRRVRDSLEYMWAKRIGMWSIDPDPEPPSEVFRRRADFIRAARRELNVGGDTDEQKPWWQKRPRWWNKPPTQPV